MSPSPAPAPLAADPATIPPLPAAELAALRDAYRDLLPVGPGLEAHLRGVVEDALAHPGSLYRAQVAWDVLTTGGVEAGEARRQAIAIEYFHASSLLFDDLPSMDDAAERRGRPCPHHRFGEAATLLGALALITRAYELLWGTLAGLPEERRRRASTLVAECLGLDGILNGQALDLHFADVERSGAEVLRVAEGKTVSLIRLTLVLPALTAGASGSTLATLERLAVAWGLAYQVLDDFKDCLMSDAETGKSTARDAALGRPSLPGVAGWRTALGRLEGLLAEARGLLADLAEDAATPVPASLPRLHGVLEGELADVRSRLPRIA